MYYSAFAWDDVSLGISVDGTDPPLALGASPPRCVGLRWVRRWRRASGNRWCKDDDHALLRADRRGRAPGGRHVLGPRVDRELGLDAADRPRRRRPQHWLRDHARHGRGPGWAAG